jgi:hypothetical protein
MGFLRLHKKSRVERNALQVVDSVKLASVKRYFNGLTEESMARTIDEVALMRSAAPALENLQTVLETDLVLPLSRALSMTGLSPRMLSREFHISEILVEPSARVTKHVRTGIVSQTPLKLVPTKIRHLLGVAAMRRDLEVPTTNWQVYTHFDQVAPDAEWKSNDRTIAIEFDAGFYSPRSVQKKARMFQAAYQGGLIWGVCSERREQTVIRHLADVNLSTPTLVVNWQE